MDQRHGAAAADPVGVAWPPREGSPGPAGRQVSPGIVRYSARSYRSVEGLR